MNWLTAIVSFAISALSGMGVGGGGLFVIWLVWVTDTPQFTAQGMNLLFFLCSAGAATLIHLRKRKLIGRAIALMAGAGVLGVLIGSELAAQVNEGFLRKIFGTMLVICGILSLKRKETET